MVENTEATKIGKDFHGEMAVRNSNKSSFADISKQLRRDRDCGFGIYDTSLSLHDQSNLSISSAGAFLF